MSFPQRVRTAAAASGVHFAASLAVTLCCAALVFGLWYPFPFAQLAGGRDLFLIVVAVDVICGPMLTLVVFNPRKARADLWRDLGIVVLFQVVALAYGLHSVMQARPVFMAFEGDRFRVVAVPDVQMDALSRAKPEYRSLSLAGPKVIGTQLAKNTDPDFLKSVQLSLRGVPPAFRPERWVSYESQAQLAIGAAQPMDLLRKKHAAAAQTINNAVAKVGRPEQRLGYLPLVSLKTDEWVVIVDLDQGMPQAYLPLSAW